MKKPNDNVIFSKDLYEAFIEAGIPFPSCKFKAGQFVRFATDGTETDGSGWCKLFPDHTGAVFGDHRTAKSFTWQQRDIKAAPPSSAELAEARRCAEEQNREAEEQRAAEQAKAQETASRLLADSTELDAAHPYVIRKGITPFGARQLPEGTLMLPVYGPEDELQSVQIIGDDGEKRFLPKGKMKSGRLILGELVDGSSLIVCEGWATGCSLHEATGYPTAVSFFGGNLATVAEDLSSRYPSARIVIAADLDKSGAGKRYADNALAVAASAVAVYPTFADGRDAGDFNDLHRDEGIEAIKEQLNMANRTLAVPVAEISGPFTSANLAGFDVRNGTADTYPLTDYGNAQRLLSIVGNRLKYVYDANKWLVWDGAAWMWDADGASVYTLAATQLPLTLIAEARRHLADADKWTCQKSCVLRSIKKSQLMAEVKRSPNRMAN